MGFGYAIIEQLIEKGLLNSISDIYYLKKEDIASLKKSGDKFATNLINAINESKKNSLDKLILLLTIFIGGFLFHTIWEAKSRYIIPYIVVLIPIASIEINKIKFKRMEKKDEFTKQTNSN